MNIQDKIIQLTNEIERHNILYHTQDAPEISDEAYDSLVQELFALEKKYPEFIQENSPSKKVGDVVRDNLPKVQHQYPQWSFDNLFNDQDLKKWEEKISKLIPNSFTQNLSYCCELKIDGAKIVLHYKDGILEKAVTRGDGVVGEDVTHTVKTISSLPKRLSKSIDLVVVGEVWVSKTKFEEINKQRKELGEKLYANPRNLGAGSLRQLDASVARSRDLQLFVYDIQYSSEDISSFLHHEELLYLEKLDLPITHTYKVCGSVEKVQDFYTHWTNKRMNQEFGIDGLVIKIDQKQIWEEMGYTAKAPRFAIAYKFPAIEATTKVTDIKVQIGRTGSLTPVAVFNPVMVDGSTVTHASLHNQDEIDRLDIKIGDTVIIKKAGDIIPKVVKVLTGLRSGEEKNFSIQSYAQQNNWKIFQREGDDIAWYVSEDSAKEELDIQNMMYAVSKTGFDIDGLGEQIIRKFYTELQKTDLVKLFDIQKEEILKLEGFKEKSAQNIIDALAVIKKETTLLRFITVLGIRHVGKETARLLCKNFESIEEIQKASQDDFLNIKGIGIQMAESLTSYFSDEKNVAFVKALLDRINVTNPDFVDVEKASQLPLFGKVFVFTGTLETMSRTEAQNKARELGAIITNSISKKTDYLVAGAKAGNKKKKAEELGVEILSEDEFKKVLT